MWRHAIPDATQPMWQMRHEKLPLDVRQWRKVVPGCCWLLLIIQNSVTLSKHIWGLKRKPRWQLPECESQGFKMGLHKPVSDQD